MAERPDRPEEGTGRDRGKPRDRRGRSLLRSNLAPPVKASVALARSREDDPIEDAREERRKKE